MSASLAIALLPADVRADGAEGRKLYASALGFEQMLVRTLAQQLTATATSEDDENGDAAADLIREQIPDALADGVGAVRTGVVRPDLAALDLHQLSHTADPARIADPATATGRSIGGAQPGHTMACTSL